jgi:glutamate synthase (NADPH/NADH) large chain
VRAILAQLGARSMDEVIGRADLLRQRETTHAKARTLDLSALLHVPSPAFAEASGALRCVEVQDHGIGDALDVELLRLAAPALDRGEPVSVTMPVRTVHRSIGTMLSGEIARRYGEKGLPAGAITLRLSGSAGQSFGAFAASGLTLELDGEANDYVGKGLSGARIVIRAPKGTQFLPDDAVIVGNTVLYGATSGEAYFGGVAGERFAVRNSGALAVVEGVGDHGCEYMTGGAVVVLGGTGRNFAAGMSGGVAFVLDEDQQFVKRCNLGQVALEPVTDAGDRALLKRLVEQHARLTGSARARHLLGRWEASIRKFVTVMPVEFKRARAEESRRGQAAFQAASGEYPRHG